MGIKGLVKWIKTYAPSGIEMINFDKMKNKRLGIDASILMYRAELAIKGSGFEMRNNKGDITSHLYVIFFNTIKMLQNNILPIYVFDGKPNELKNKILEEREIKKEKIRELIKNKKLTKEQANKLELQTFCINNKMHDDLVKMLSLMSIPYIQAESEADSLLAYMNTNGYIDGVISEDTDICIFGATDLYKNVFTHMNIKRKNLIEHIQYQNILKELKWSRNQFVTLAILLGCDYAPHLKGIGMVTATELVNNKKSLEEISQEHTTNTEEIKTINYAKNFILTDSLAQPKEIIDKLENLKFGPIHKNKLYDFLVNDNQIDKDRVTKGIENITKALQKFKTIKI
ncbi:MAG: putative 5'-3' exonuclease [Terrestrivirus sp.]|uniref:Putative 5'-3' exonuclease n=1 Tax=Terrestrivirus sp. TaxID=2487775 RepID=A0A3G4ZP76_9VIRU|nr:MAG: putative 5'-3' exonuclease [Terrestrivirus sp.]